MGMFKDCGCGCKGKNQQKKFLTSAIAGLLFFIVANPETFIIVRKFLGNWIANQYGTPTMYGLLFHAFVFMMITWAMMNIGGRENADGAEEPKADKTSEPPPPSISGSAPVPNTKDLPPVMAMEQPIADTPAITTSPKPSESVNNGTMSYMNNLFGGPPSAPLNGSGTNWTKCECKNGTQVMVLGS